MTGLSRWGSMCDGEITYEAVAEAQLPYTPLAEVLG
jgi:hypothetical protein